MYQPLSHYNGFSCYVIRGRIIILSHYSGFPRSKYLLPSPKYFLCSGCSAWDHYPSETDDHLGTHWQKDLFQYRAIPR